MDNMSMLKALEKWILSIIIGFCLILTACQKVETVIEDNNTPIIEEEAAVTDNSVIESTELEETKPEETELEKIEPEETAPDDENKTNPATYKDIMLDLYNNHNLLGFGDLSGITMSLDIYMSENQFAFADVDADGQEELLVYYLTTAVAGHIGAIYDYNDEIDECYLKFTGYPLLSFYENGTLEEGWSHNQGYAGDFWPYTLHEYDEENDRYITVNYVDAYDRTLYEANQDALAERSFPYDIDIDGNGFVYYIYSYEDGLKDYQELQAVDDDIYQAWLQEYTDGTKKIEIIFYSITEENINRILG